MSPRAPQWKDRVVVQSEWLGKAGDGQGEKLQNGTLVEVCPGRTLGAIQTRSSYRSYQVDEDFIRDLLTERIGRMV
jgi:hypothetical protein